MDDEPVGARAARAGWSPDEFDAYLAGPQGKVSGSPSRRRSRRGRNHIKELKSLASESDVWAPAQWRDRRSRLFERSRQIVLY